MEFISKNFRIFASEFNQIALYEQRKFPQNHRHRPGRALGRGPRGTLYIHAPSVSDTASTPKHHSKRPATMSALKKIYGQRQDAIITDCFVVMPDGVTDADGNRRYCKIANLRVLSGEDYSDFDYDVLIGMDVITQGDFIVSTVHDETTFSFRMPAQGITIE